MMNSNIHASFDGPIVIIGFGSIGRGFITLLQRHIECLQDRICVVAPASNDFEILRALGIELIQASLTAQNFRGVLRPLLLRDTRRGLIINLAVNVSSLDLMAFAKEIDCHYIDTAIELWPDYYEDPARNVSDRTDYSLRESILDLERRRPGGATAISCCGANPGTVSWFVKQALVNLARDTGVEMSWPRCREDWGALAQRLGIKGIHIAERDTQRSSGTRRLGSFVNTWSVEAFITETLRPAELGWGTHEKILPKEARFHVNGCGASIYLLRAGGKTRVRSWTPSVGPQYGFLVTHNEATSIADFLTVRDHGTVQYRPTCMFAYRPCDEAMLSLANMYDARIPDAGSWHVLDETTIVEGVDELGVLLYGHNRNAYWFGSRLSIEQARALAPFQNATTLQVASAVIAGIVWLVENPEEGIIDTDGMDFQRPLEIQMPYLGDVSGTYTDWTPISNRNPLTPEQFDHDDPWQFSNIVDS